MTSQTKPLLSAGAGLLAAATVITATPAIDAGQHALAALRPSSSSYEMLASQTASGSGLLQAIEKFLADHQTAVLAFAAKVPSFDIGPVTVGQAVLAKAYYFGYSGSATGLPGVIAYVESQLGIPKSMASPTVTSGSGSHPFEALVLKLTAMIPKFKIGPVQLGGSLLADAFYHGYNGSPTGLPGIVAYIKSQLTPPTSVASTATEHVAVTKSVASVPKPAATAVTVSVPAPTKTKAPATAAAAARTSSKHVTTTPTAHLHANGHPRR